MRLYTFMYHRPKSTPFPSLREGRGGVRLVCDAEGSDYDRPQRDWYNEVYNCQGLRSGAAWATRRRSPDGS